MEKEKITVKECIRRGNAKHKAGRYEEAIIEYDRAIELEPNNAEAYSDRGISKLRLNKSKEALADYDKAIELDPNYDASYHNRGTLKSIQGKHKEALLDFNKIIELTPDYARAYLNRSRIKAVLGDLEGALADCNTVIKLKPKSSDSYNARALVKARMCDYSGALVDLDNASKFKSEDEWIGDEFPDMLFQEQKSSRAKGKKHYSFDEKRDTDNIKDYRSQPMVENYVNAILNLQLPPEIYLRLRILQKSGYKYAEAARALGIPFNTMWETTMRVVKKIEKAITHPEGIKSE